LKSPQIINSTFGLYKYFKIRPSFTANSPKFPLGDVYMHNNYNREVTNVDLSCA